MLTQTYWSSTLAGLHCKTHVYLGLLAAITINFKSAFKYLYIVAILNTDLLGTSLTSIDNYHFLS